MKFFTNYIFFVFLGIGGIFLTFHLFTSGEMKPDKEAHKLDSSILPEISVTKTDKFGSPLEWKSPETNSERIEDKEVLILVDSYKNMVRKSLTMESAKEYQSFIESSSHNEKFALIMKNTLQDHIFSLNKFGQSQAEARVLALRILSERMKKNIGFELIEVINSLGVYSQTNLTDKRRQDEDLKEAIFQYFKITLSGKIIDEMEVAFAINNLDFRNFSDSSRLELRKILGEYLSPILFENTNGAIEKSFGEDFL